MAFGIWELLHDGGAGSQQSRVCWCQDCTSVIHFIWMKTSAGNKAEDMQGPLSDFLERKKKTKTKNQKERKAFTLTLRRK